MKHNPSGESSGLLQFIIVAISVAIFGYFAISKFIGPDGKFIPWTKNVPKDAR